MLAGRSRLVSPRAARRRSAMLRIAALLLPLGFLALPPAAPAQQPDAKPRLDAVGDPLPTGAVLRLGTSRWRHGAAVAALVFASDGKSLFSASWDGTARHWNVSDGKEVRQWQAHGTVTGLALTPDGKTLLTSGGNNTLALWDIESGKLKEHL